MTGTLYCTNKEHGESAVCSSGGRVILSYLNVLITNHLQDPDVDVLLTYRCQKGVNELSFKHTQ